MNEAKVPQGGQSRADTIFTSHDFKQPNHATRLVPRRVCARVLKLNPHREGWAERRQTHGVRAKHSVGPAHDAADQALARRLASNNVGRSPLGAPPWRFLGSGSALPSAALPPQRVQRAPRGTGLSAWRADSRASRTCDYEPHRGTPRPAPSSGSSLEDAPRRARLICI